MPAIRVCLAYLVNSQHTVFCNLPNILAAVTQSTAAYPSWCSWNHYEFKSLQNQISLPAEGDTMLCLVKYLSMAYIVCCITMWKQRWQVYSKHVPKASLLHNKPASAGILPGNFCAQGHDKRYSLYDVNLLPP
jgi:hypothetical protein